MMAFPSGAIRESKPILLAITFAHGALPQDRKGTNVTIKEKNGKSGAPRLLEKMPCQCPRTVPWHLPSHSPGPQLHHMWARFSFLVDPCASLINTPTNKHGSHHYREDFLTT